PGGGHEEADHADVVVPGLPVDDEAADGGREEGVVSGAGRGALRLDVDPDDRAEGRAQAGDDDEVIAGRAVDEQGLVTRVERVGRQERDPLRGGGHRQGALDIGDGVVGGGGPAGGDGVTARRAGGGGRGGQHGLGGQVGGRVP